MNSEINKDYIGVIAENDDNLLEYKQIPIDDTSLNIYAELKAMAANDNRTVLDLQNKFQQHFSSYPRYIDFCHPYSYSASYINGPTYPKCLSYNEYQGELKKSDSNSLKQRFVSSVYRYIIAYAYTQKLESLRKNTANKMFSLEKIGWHAYDYTINQNIEIRVSSNFGFGSSSYFYVNLKYKGIDILPYSDTVRYYKANMIDFIRYTRQYCTERDNWNIALNFVVDTANCAIKDEQAFITKWIFNEIEELMVGLELMAKNPNKEYDKISKRDAGALGLISVRNISSNEKETYNIYPTEAVIAFQAEKITGALQLLDSIASLIDVYPKVYEVINRIKEINTGLYPHFKEAIINTENKIKPLQVKVDILSEKENILVEQCKPYEDEIFALFEKADKEAKGKNPTEYVYMYNIKREYIQSHSNYKRLLDQISSICNEMTRIKNTICGLNNFISQLNRCVENIIKYTEIA